MHLNINFIQMHLNITTVHFEYLEKLIGATEISFRDFTQV